MPYCLYKTKLLLHTQASSRSASRGFIVVSALIAAGAAAAAGRNERVELVQNKDDDNDRFPPERDLEV